MPWALGPPREFILIYFRCSVNGKWYWYWYIKWRRLFKSGGAFLWPGDMFVCRLGERGGGRGGASGGGCCGHSVDTNVTIFVTPTYTTRKCFNLLSDLARRFVSGDNPTQPTFLVAASAQLTAWERLLLGAHIIINGSFAYQRDTTMNIWTVLRRVVCSTSYNTTCIYLPSKRTATSLMAINS